MARAARRPGESQHRKRRSSQAHSAPLKQMNLHAAGIDVGAACHWVAVPPDRDAQPVQRFGAFTADLYAFIDQPEVIKKILQHLSLWEESQAPPESEPPIQEITFDPSYSQLI